MNSSETKTEIYGKKVAYTNKSVFRVEVSKNEKASYEGVYANSNPLGAIKYYESTPVPAGGKARVRLVKDGDGFQIITKKS